MSEIKPTMANHTFDDSCIVYGHNKIQTKNMQWLCIKDIYQKLLKKGDYDVGGTYNGDVADYWFLFRSDSFGDNFMLHLYIGNRQESSFFLSVSSRNELTHMSTKKQDVIKRSHLPLSLTTRHFKKVSDNTYSFVTSFSFTGPEVEQLKERELFISAKLLPASSQGVDHNIVRSVKLNHDLGNLLKDPILSDFTIESAEGRQFPVHQAVLAAQSEVFKAMLKGDTAESQNHQVKLAVISNEDLECMLQYMYTGSVENIMSRDCRSLLMLADHYHLPGLGELAQCALRRQLCAENALELATLADMYNCNVLKNATFTFVKNNPDVLLSESWKQFKDMDVIKKLFEFIHKEQIAS